MRYEDIKAARGKRVAKEAAEEVTKEAAVALRKRSRGRKRKSSATAAAAKARRARKSEVAAEHEITILYRGSLYTIFQFPSDSDGWRLV